MSTADETIPAAEPQATEVPAPEPALPSETAVPTTSLPAHPPTSGSRWPKWVTVTASGVALVVGLGGGVGIGYALWGTGPNLPAGAPGFPGGAPGDDWPGGERPEDGVFPGFPGQDGERQDGGRSGDDLSNGERSTTGEGSAARDDDPPAAAEANDAPTSEN